MRVLGWIAGLFGVVQACGPGAATADCVDYLDYLHWLGGVPMDWPTGCHLEAVAQTGDYAFVAGWTGGGPGVLFVADVTDPQSPILVTDMLLPGAGSDVARTGNFLCIAQGDSGLVTVDVSNPRSPVIRGRVDTPGYAASVVVAGGYAYVADWDGLQIIGIQNPSFPQLMGHIALEGVTGIAVSGSYAYVAGPESGLTVVAVANAWYPSVCGWTATSGFDFTNVAMSGHYVVMTTNNHLEVVDVLDPWHPQPVASLVTNQGYPWFNDLAVLDGRAYVTAYSSMLVVDLSTPSEPRIVGCVPTQGWGYGVVVNGTRAFLANGSGLQVVDISNPEGPPILGSVSTQGYVRALAESGSIGYAAYSSGLAVLDLSDPSAPTLGGPVDDPEPDRGRGGFRNARVCSELRRRSVRPGRVGRGQPGDRGQPAVAGDHGGSDVGGLSRVPGRARGRTAERRGRHRSAEPAPVGVHESSWQGGGRLRVGPLPLRGLRGLRDAGHRHRGSGEPRSRRAGQRPGQRVRLGLLG
jgi:hypothetical protein